MIAVWIALAAFALSCAIAVLVGKCIRTDDGGDQ